MRIPAHIGVGAAVCLLALLGSGCSLLARQGPPLPRARVLEQLEAHSGTFRSLIDTEMSLLIRYRTDGRERRTPTLTGHVALDRELPGLWLSAEKVGRPVFSLKARGDRFWLALHQTAELVSGGPLAYAKVPYLVRPAEARRLLAGADGLGLRWPTTVMTVEDRHYCFETRVFGGPYARVLVDRRELVVNVVRRYDALGRVTSELRLDDYRPVGGKLFPHRFTVVRPSAGATVQLRLGSPKLDKPIPARAFQPAPRPGWTHRDLDREPLSNVEAFAGD